MVARGWGSKEQRVTIDEEDEVLEMDGGDGSTTM